MKWFGSSRRTKGVYRLIVSIESGSVGASLIFVPNKKTKDAVQILATIRREFSTPEFMTLQRMQFGVYETLDRVLREVHSIKTLPKPQSIEIILGAPWYTISMTKTVRHEKEVTACTKKLIATLQQEAQMQVLLDMKSRGLYQEPFCIETEISSTKVDYKTIEILPNTYTNLDIEWFVSCTSQSFIDEIENCINRTYVCSCTYSTAAYAMAQVGYRSVSSPDISKIAFLYISDECSECSYITEYGVDGLATFPMGHVTILRHVMKSFGGTFDAARAQIAAYEDNHLTEVKKDSVEQALVHICDEYAHALFKTLHAFVRGSSDVSIPERIFVFTHHPAHTWYQHVFSSEQFKMLAQEHQQIIRIEPFPIFEIQNRICQIQGVIEDIPLLVYSAFSFIKHPVQ